MRVDEYLQTQACWSDCAGLCRSYRLVSFGVTRRCVWRGVAAPSGAVSADTSSPRGAPARGCVFRLTDTAYLHMVNIVSNDAHISPPQERQFAAFAVVRLRAPRRPGERSAPREPSGDPGWCAVGSTGLCVTGAAMARYTPPLYLYSTCTLLLVRSVSQQPWLVHSTWGLQ